MALTDKLTAVADSIRAKTGKNDLLTLDEMPNEIGSISSLADIPKDVLTIKGGEFQSFTTNEFWKRVFPYIINNIETADLTTLSSAFNGINVDHIPFEINCKAGTNVTLSKAFAYSYIKSVPKINNCRPSDLSYMFSGCNYLTEIPEDDLIDWFDWSYIDGSTSGSAGSLSQFCAYCGSLRKLPLKIYRKANPYSTYSNAFYASVLSSCYRVAEAVDIPIPYVNPMTSNMFSNSFTKAAMLKRFTFEMPDGQPKTVQWKSQTIDLSSNAGYIGITDEQRYFLEYNNDITVQDKVSNSTSYEALKNTPNWYTNSFYFARYNHDSAVETINSLPDTSAYLAEAGGTNTIKFLKNCGRDTDGGAIGNLTAEEIAVATAKGWTVTLV